jgi:hypothetical protein
MATAGSSQKPSGRRRIGNIPMAKIGKILDRFGNAARAGEKTAFRIVP